MTTKGSKGWSAIRRQLINRTTRELLALVKDLYEVSAANRDFLQARFRGETAAGPALEQYRRTIVEQFFPQHGFGKLKLADARKAIRDYRKATGNPEGTIDLLLTYVENGTEFTKEFGDINEAYYNSLDSALDELARLLLQSGPALYARFRNRALRVKELARDIGWGYGDSVADQVARLETRFGHVQIQSS
ncbi:MAG: hypothetical protein NTY77_13745 [Elusimicrobia bacterium]|nr:hypothetical protein [Elusimicrobiota bacterium]